MNKFDTEITKLEPLTQNTKNEQDKELNEVKTVTESQERILTSFDKGYEEQQKKLQTKSITVTTGFKYKTHTVAGVLEEYDITTLRVSIKEHGLFQPVLLWWDKSTKEWYLVDGRHRVKAWYELYDTDIQTHKLPKRTKEEDLPKVILDAQIIGRGLDVICANCEATLYLKNNGGAAVSLADNYDILNPKMLSALKTIYEVRPIWFKTLRNGDFVDTGDGKPTKSTQKLASMCVAERDKGKPNTDKETGDESIAILFDTMTPIMTAVAKSIGNDSAALYVADRLLKQLTSHIEPAIHLSIPARHIQELEQEVETISKNNNLLAEHSEQVKSELDDFKVMYTEYRLSENVDDTGCENDQNEEW